MATDNTAVLQQFQTVVTNLTAKVQQVSDDVSAETTKLADVKTRQEKMIADLQALQNSQPNLSAILTPFITQLQDTTSVVGTSHTTLTQNAVTLDSIGATATAADPGAATGTTINP